MDNIGKIKDFFNELASTWDDKNADSKGAEKIMKQFSSKISGKDVLDIGCGTGILYEPIIKAKAKTYTGIDVSEEMIKQAREKYPDANFKIKDILKMNNQDGFDTIIMYNVYPHLSNKTKLVDKAYELLRTNGSFIVAHGSSRDTINSHHSSHAIEVSQKLMKAQEESEIWKNKFNIEIIRDNDLYYFAGTKK